MKSLLAMVLATFLPVFGLNAANIGIIDSGTDLGHTDLVENAWINTDEIADNDSDDDDNGYTDDITGWNFAEDNNKIIDMKYEGTFSDDVYKFFRMQLKMLKKTITEAEIAWIKEKVKNKEFIAELNKFGNFIHGTHVAGIAAKESRDARILGAKIMPTEVKRPTDAKMLAMIDEARKSGRKVDFMKDFMARMFMDQVVNQQVTTLVKVGKYMASEEMQVANCSFGIGPQQAKMIAKKILETVGAKPDEEDVKKYAVIFMDKLVKKMKDFVDASPKTLFVMAAGNDGTNNDELGAAPANIKADNSITVAATFGVDRIARFSNFGTAMVEVAAPGVGILSAIPGNDHMHFSGTSQAAPFVANIAGAIMDENSELTLLDVKKIIMKTVDVKDFLKGKVTSSGIANRERALEAARLTLDMEIDEAITTSLDTIEDAISDRSINPAAEAFVLPLPSLFK